MEAASVNVESLSSPDEQKTGSQRGRISRTTRYFLNNDSLYNICESLFVFFVKMLRNFENRLTTNPNPIPIPIPIPKI